MATYKVFYYVSGNKDLKEKEYNSSINVNNLPVYLLEQDPTITKIPRIDILSDPEGINTDEALGIHHLGEN
jgi:hypothetical protein